jgi:hypothetical protein
VHDDAFRRWIERIGDVRVTRKLANAQALDRILEGCNDRLDRRIVFAALDERLDDVRVFHGVLPFIVPLWTCMAAAELSDPAYSQMEMLQISTVWGEDDSKPL